MNLADDAGIRGFGGPFVRTAGLPLMKARDSVGPLYGVGFIRTGSNGD